MNSIFQRINEKNRRFFRVLLTAGVLVILLTLVSLPLPASADTANWPGAQSTQIKITAGDGGVNNKFGASVSCDGNTAIIGAPFADSGTLQTGAVYVFVKSGTAWTQQAKLVASDGGVLDYFGISVSINGDTAIIGAYGTAGGKGAAYVFTRSGVTWTQQAKVVAGDGVIRDSFGGSVSVNGDTAVIGASNKGAAYVFTRSGTTWTQQTKLIASDGVANDSFGSSVSINGGTTIIGAVGAASGKGAAYVFTRSSTTSGTTWTQQVKLTAADGVPNDRFGVSVSIDGDTAAIGALGFKSVEGVTSIFTRSGTTWTQQAQLIASDGVAGDQFGFSVSINGDTAAIGAAGAGSDAGAGYVFTRSGTTWTQQTKLTAADGAAADSFGQSVSISGNIAIFGALGDDTNKGSAYIFDGSGGQAMVAATVTLSNISVTIPSGYPTSVDYGVLQLNSQAVPQTYTPAGNTYLRVQNNGGAPEDLVIKGANATCGTGTWTIGSLPGANTYSHLFGVGATPSSYAVLGTGGSTLAGNVAVNGNVDFNLKIQTPSSSTVYGKYSTTVSIIATAH